MNRLLNKRLNITALMTTVSTVCGYYWYQKQYKHTFVANNRQLIPKLKLKTVQMFDTKNYTIDEIVEHFIKRLVLVYTMTGFDTNNDSEYFMGSGIVINKEYILTNCHVIDGYKKIAVQPVGSDSNGSDSGSTSGSNSGSDSVSDSGSDIETIIAQLVYAEPELDAALIRIPDELDIEAVEFGTGVVPGEPLVIIGNPDIDFTPAVGVVQTIGRSGHTISVGTYETFPTYVSNNCRHLTYDCPQYEGYSGAPVINAAQKVVGLVWGGVNDYRENCAIPSDSVTAFIERGLKFEREDKEDRYTYQTSKSLGLVVKSAADINTVQQRIYGRFYPTITAPFVCHKLMTNSSAKEDFIESDIIVAVNEMAVNSVSELRDCIDKCPTGEELDIIVIRSLNPNNKIHIKVKSQPIVCPVI